MPRLVFINANDEKLHLNHSYHDVGDAASDLRGDVMGQLIAIHGKKAERIKEVHVVPDENDESESLLIDYSTTQPHCNVCGYLKPNQVRQENDRPVCIECDEYAD